MAALASGDKNDNRDTKVVFVSLLPTRLPDESSGRGFFLDDSSLSVGSPPENFLAYC
jgi:hypothetical protein